jgi:hypothetical protein
MVVAAVPLLPIGCHEGGEDGSSGAATMTVSSPGAYGQEGVVRELGSGAGGADLTVDEAAVYQTIEGFGGAFNEQGWDALPVRRLQVDLPAGDWATVTC